MSGVTLPWTDSPGFWRSGRTYSTRTLSCCHENALLPPQWDLSTLLPQSLPYSLPFSTSSISLLFSTFRCLPENCPTGASFISHSYPTLVNRRRELVAPNLIAYLYPSFPSLLLPRSTSGHLSQSKSFLRPFLWCGGAVVTLLLPLLLHSLQRVLDSTSRRHR